MKGLWNVFVLALCLCLSSQGLAFASPAESSTKPAPDNVIGWLTEGNVRFMKGESVHPHADAARLKLADTESQGKYALATVLSCSDSRVPPEILFDAGIMDLFVVRVAGNVANTDEIGSMEYGLCHVNTPVLVVLGHTQCGAVTAVTDEVTGHGHPLERNIPPLVASIVPAVKRTIAEHPDLKGGELVKCAIETNVWQVIENTLMQSPAVREQIKSGKVKIAPAIYDLHTGSVNWLPAERVSSILAAVEASPNKAVGAMYEAKEQAKAAPAAKADDLTTKFEAKSAEAANELKAARGKLDDMAAQLATLAEKAKTAGVEASSEQTKALTAELKSLHSSLDARLSAVEASKGSSSMLPYLLVLVVLVGFFYLSKKICKISKHVDELKAEHKHEHKA